MVSVAREMSRQNFTLPLLIGGATTSPAHTAVKIAPEYAPGVIHVLDASRVVNVVSLLLSPAQKPAYLAEVVAKQERQRVEFGERQNKRALLPLAEARARPADIRLEHRGYPAPGVPRHADVHHRFNRRGGTAGPAEDPTPSLPDGAPSGRAPHHSRSTRSSPTLIGAPSFSAWNSTAATPTSSPMPSWAPRPPSSLPTRRNSPARIVAEKRYTARAVIAFWPANSVGDGVEVYADESSRVQHTFHFLRQQQEKPAGQFNHCLADYIAPRDSGRLDFIGGFAVTAGHGSKNSPPSSKPRTTTTTPSWLRPSATASPRRWPS